MFYNKKVPQNILVVFILHAQKKCFMTQITRRGAYEFLNLNKQIYYI